MDADVGAFEGVAELGVVQLADGACQILRRVKLHHANHTAPIPEDIHIVGRAHLPEVILHPSMYIVYCAHGSQALCPADQQSDFPDALASALTGAARWVLS